jgi:hypothetical protein
MEKKYIIKNGGYPPLLLSKSKDEPKDTSLERTYSNTLKTNINIRQILSENKKSFIFNPNKDDQLEIVSEI